MSRATILFAKAPVPGRVKTRLIPSVGAEKAAEIYEKLLRRNMSVLESVDRSENYLFAHARHESVYFEKFTHWTLRSQVEGELGVRMKSAINEVLEHHRHVVLIGSDIADAQGADIREAFLKLESGVDLVIGPSFDGGYWLIGTQRRDLQVFDDIPWSSPEVFDRTLQATAKEKLNYALLSKRHDIDTPEDLQFF